MTGMESMTEVGMEIGRTPTHAVKTGGRGIIAKECFLRFAVMVAEI